jgi:hypothetical protein
MPFFAREEARAIMPARVADEAGRAALQKISASPPMEICGGDRYPPRSAGESKLNATAQFGAKKTPISATTRTSRRTNVRHYSTELLLGASSCLHGMPRSTEVMGLF